MRRARKPPKRLAEHPGFARVVERLERGKAVLVSAVPTARREGTPLAEALHGFEEALRQAAGDMGGWRGAASEAAWLACRAAIEESAARAERVRLAAPALDFEGLVTVIGDLLAPLSAFEAAAREAHD